MGESFWNPDELEIFAFQMDSRPFSEIRRTGTDVDGNVQNMSGKHAHEFALRLSKLVMQPSQYSTPRKRLVVLNK